MLDAMDGDLLERYGKGQSHCTRAVTNAGMPAMSVAVAAVQLSTCHKIATMIHELITPTMKTMTLRSLEEALTIHLTWKVKLVRTAAKDTACPYSFRHIWF